MRAVEAPRARFRFSTSWSPRHGSTPQGRRAAPADWALEPGTHEQVVEEAIGLPDRAEAGCERRSDRDEHDLAGDRRVEILRPMAAWCSYMNAASRAATTTSWNAIALGEEADANSCHRFRRNTDGHRWPQMDTDGTRTRPRPAPITTKQHEARPAASNELGGGFCAHWGAAARGSCVHLWIRVIEQRATTIERGGPA